MQKLIGILLGMILSVALLAQGVNSNSDSGRIEAELISADPESTTLHYHFTGFDLSEITSEGETYHLIELDNSAPLLIAGAPEVRITANSVIIPDDGTMAIEILSSSYQEYHNINLAPSKGNLTRDVNPSEVPYQKGAIYSQDRFYPGSLAMLRDPYILRDFRGQAVVVQPFQYNPVTRTLRVYHDITLKVFRNGSGGMNAIQRASLPQSFVDEFLQIYKRHFINFDALGINYTPVGEEGNMLVISHGPFMSEMNDFVLWKNQKGIPCEIVDVATIGATAAAIKSYVVNYYNTHGLTYLLLVGDAAQIPTNNLSSGHSDNAYGYIAGNDSYPEVFVGRFSSESSQHVQTQVIRTLSYEINPDTVGGWLAKSIGIASDEGPGHYGEMDYEHVRYMQTDLLGFTYTHNPEFFEGSQGGNDAPGNPTSTMISNAVNDGAGIILYTGHGSTTSWGTSGFNNTAIGNLTNTSRWPFIWSVACVNGNFVNNTCFGEAWLRANINDQPTGSVAVLASTINQSWNPPMEGQDEMVDILVESYQNNIKRTFGGLSMNGCMKMNDVYGTQGYPMTDTWNLFGDPSVNVFTKSPLPINATHQPVAVLGSTLFPVFCPVDSAKATLTHNGQIIGTGIVTGSAVNISFTSPLMPDTLLLVITAFNHIPYIADIPLIVANSPFVIYNSHQVNDHTGNNNQKADFGETVTLDVSLENIGVQTANNVTAILQSLDPHVTVIDSIAMFGNITDGITQQILSAFTITLSDSVPNGHMAPMRLTVVDNATNQWISNFSLLCHAPQLVFDTIYFDDVTAGNANGKLEPGEVVLIKAVVKNVGGAEATQHSCSVTSSLSAAQLFGSITESWNQLPLYTPYNVQFYARLDTGVAAGTAFNFDIDFITGAYSAKGYIGDIVNSGDEDFETGDFTKFNWQHSGNNSWTITANQPYEGSYCARSGVIGNNANSTLSIDWYAAYPDTISFWLKVSCENGSAYGQKWDFLEFFINGVSQDWWDGNQAWMKVSYPVPMGQHTFTWRYEKDQYAVGGSDAAWIDLITFPAAGNEVTLKPFLLLDATLVSDASGNNNGMVEPGELIDIHCQLVNMGFVHSPNVQGLLTTTDPMVTITDPVIQPGTVPAGATTTPGADILQVLISSTAIAGQKFDFDLTITDDSLNTWVYPVFLSVDATIGCEEPFAKKQFSIFPNPFADNLNLRLPVTESTTPARITIFTLDGRIVLDEIVPEVSPDTHVTLNTSGMPTGALLVRVTMKDEVYTAKVLRVN